MRLDLSRMVCYVGCREVPIADFDFKLTKRPDKRKRAAGGISAPFSSMSEASRERVLGQNYWAEGSIVADCYIRKQDAVRVYYQFPKYPATVYGMFRCFAGFHGGHPFDKEKPLAHPCYAGPFTSDRHYWGAGVVPIPGQIEIAKIKETWTDNLVMDELSRLCR